ncbi:MAG: type II secretion system F family protein [Isosphaeraceae bacterium]
MADAVAGGSDGGGRITVEQLEALNAEIAALVRAGVPLDRGLLRTGEDIGGSLGRISGVLGRRLGRGESLEQALEAEGSSIPPLYRAVVQAGARSGRLATALEGFSGYLRSYSDARSAIGVALWYPVLVLTLAYVLFLGLVAILIPRLVVSFESLDVAIAAPLRWLERFGELATYWWPIGPLLLLLLLLAWWRSGSASNFQDHSWSLLRLFPWMSSLLSDYESAGFADLMALLLEHRVPYPEAIAVAADATGDPEMSRGARQVASEVRRGRPPSEALRELPPGAFSPLMRWALAAEPERGDLVESLRSLGPMYRKRAAYQAEKLQVFLPTLLMLGLGASATAIYGLTLFIPLSALLSGLAFP